ncbi:MAG: ABC transporter permease [Chloroflexi bacterium]|nr:ABC transporter permease [Chloroflexota bacterium]MCY3697902.1 ABC transporter permease [Chloroflexota bacterium]
MSARSERLDTWTMPDRSESPFRRGTRALLRKRVAVVCMITIFVLYGAGMYTFLDAFGVDTGLQDPTQTNLSERRTTREVNGVPESLGSFTERLGVEIATVAALNPELVDEYGLLTTETVLPGRTEIILGMDESLQPPSSRHWFGTDRSGRDLFSRALFSLRTTVVITVISVVMGNLFLGLGLGLLAGYRGGRVDAAVMRLADLVLAMPGLVYLIVIVAVLRDRITDWFRSLEDAIGADWLIAQGVDDYVLIVFAMSLLGWAGAARFYRGQVLSLREREFILAAETIGAGTPRVLVRHLFPGILPWFVVGFSASMGEMAGNEVVLTWLGIGITAPTPSFGTMVAAAGGFTSLTQYPWMLLVPLLFVLPILLAFNLLGDAINDALNPRLR